jgi:hypothetical protein
LDEHESRYGEQEDPIPREELNFERRRLGEAAAAAPSRELAAFPGKLKLGIRIKNSLKVQQSF